MHKANIHALRGKRVHMVGIGGSSMSGLAEMLMREGYAVSGTDQDEGYTLSRLRDLGIEARAGHHPQMVDGAALVVYSAAVPREDPERLRAQELGIPQMERAVLLGELMAGFARQICIAGTHGKTTTSGMLAQALMMMGEDPTVHIGGSLDAIGGSVRVGGKEYFLAEACEFNRSFLNMPVTMALLLNIEEDHLDTYGDMAHVEEAYAQFLARLPEDGKIIVYGEDERALRTAKKVGRAIHTFGLETDNDYVVSELSYSDAGNAAFSLTYKGVLLCETNLLVKGLYNALHAAAALAAVHQLGLDVEKAAVALSGFTGVHRRFEHTGVVQGMDMYHDYGHNPAEMQVAIGMAAMQDRRVIAVMQPHTFSRVKSLFDAYLTCTKEADITLVTDIYAAREIDPGDIHASQLVEGMQANGITAYLTPGFDDVESWLLTHGRPGDLVITMGCGNINLLNIQMQQHEDDKQSGRRDNGN
ncbi:MAG: UDP-N-acetylmuramate--L-alanine ligase [Christensenellales bacterium]